MACKKYSVLLLSVNKFVSLLLVLLSDMKKLYGGLLKEFFDNKLLYKVSYEANKVL